MKRCRKITTIIFSLLFASLFISSQNSQSEVKKKEISVRGGTYRRPLEFMPRTLDPALAADIYSVTVIHQLFDGLVQFDQNLNIIPAIAKSWKISHDGLTYTFFLREGVKFHNGRELTADDFVYSFTRIVDPKSKTLAAQLLEKVSGFKEFESGKTKYIDGFKSLGKHIFEIRLDSPFYPFLSILGIINFKVVPKEEIEKAGALFSRNPIGTGPFRFASMKEGEEIILAGNQEYFEGKPYLDKILFKIFHGAPRERILKEFKGNGLEESFIPPGEMEEMVERKPYIFLQKPILSLRFYGLNSMLKPLDNKNLRKAINFGINKKAILSEIHKNQFHLSKGILPLGMPGFDPEKDPYPYDEVRAARLLADAGFPKGGGLSSLEIWSASKSEAAQRELDEIRSQLSKIGIQCMIYFETNWPNFESRVRENKAPVFVYAWYADYPDPDNFLGALFHSKSRTNVTRFHHPEVDRLLDQARAERDYLKRMEMYRKIERMILDDAPIVPMINHLFQMVYQPYVRGIEVNALGGPYIPMKKIWLKKRK
jgi:peptide/nickel transport system substrate-binding protein/oligopeptide transport system substrate-binding protein